MYQTNFHYSLSGSSNASSDIQQKENVPQPGHSGNQSPIKKRKLNDFKTDELQNMMAKQTQEYFDLFDALTVMPKKTRLEILVENDQAIVSGKDEVISISFDENTFCLKKCF